MTAFSSLNHRKSGYILFYDMADLIIFITNVYVMILEECKNMFYETFFFRKVLCDCLFTLKRKHVKCVETGSCTNVSFLYRNLVAYLSTLLFEFFHYLCTATHSTAHKSLLCNFKYYTTFQ